MKVIVLLVVMVIFSLLAPTSAQIRSGQDCSTDLKVAKATIQSQQMLLEAYKLRVNTLASDNETLVTTKNDLSAVNIQLINKNAQLVSTVDKLNAQIATLSTTNIKNHLVIAEQLKINEALMAERNKYLRKIRKANGTTFCEVFHIGCINIK